MCWTPCTTTGCALPSMLRMPLTRKIWLPTKAHQQLEPGSQGFFRDGLLDGEAKGADVVVMPVRIMLAVRVRMAVRVMRRVVVTLMVVILMLVGVPMGRRRRVGFFAEPARHVG